MLPKSHPVRAIALFAVFAVCADLLLAACASMRNSGGGKETVLYEEGFEYYDGGWLPRGTASVRVTDARSHSGSKSLHVKNRSKTWMGAIRPFTLFKPSQSYRISLWVLVEEGAETPVIGLQVQQEIDGEGETYQAIGGERVPLGVWTYIEGELSVPRSRYESVISVYLESAYKADDATVPSDLFNFYIDDVRVVRLPPAPPPMVELDIPALSSLLPEIPLGAAIDYSYLDPRNIHHGFLRHFGVFVYGNEMKQDALQPSEGRFNFSKADALMDYAAKNGKKVRGHVLVWHTQVPEWFFQGSGPDGLATKEELYARMENHIKTVVGRYRGRVDSWDVVNEALEDDGTFRNSKYYQIAGSHEYIAKAFQWAREADPDAKLFINDFGVEAANAKQDAYFELVRTLIDEGVPVDGVGLQGHINITWPTPADFRGAIRRFASLGLKVQVTELDMSIYSSGAEPRKRADRDILLAQAAKYRDLFTVFREEAREGNLDMVVLWGIADDGTWLDNHPVRGRTDYPLFFGKDLRAKPAYWIMVDPEKLPVQIKKTDASFSETAITGIDDPFWRLVSPRAIADAKGNSYGRFKVAWSAGRLHVMVTVDGAAEASSDDVTVFIDPENIKGDTLNPQSFSMRFSRSQALWDDGDGYTLLAEIPFNGKLEQKAGFDIRIRSGGGQYSWNDFSNSQDFSTVNYGTVNLRALPPVAAAKRGTVDLGARAARELDPAWSAAEPVPMNVKTEGYTEDGSRFRALWDDSFLYVLAEVADSSLDDKSAIVHEQDSVEVFVDQNNGKTALYEPDDGQYRVSFRNSASFNGGDSSRFRSRTIIIPGGYRAEMAIPLYAIKPEAGTLVGFDVQINDATNGARTGIRNWANDTNMGYLDTSGFGLLLLE